MSLSQNVHTHALTVAPYCHQAAPAAVLSCVWSFKRPRLT